MKIELVYKSLMRRIIEVPEAQIMEAGIVVSEGRLFVYEHPTTFRKIPRFVEQSVYTQGSC